MECCHDKFNTIFSKMLRKSTRINCKIIRNILFQTVDGNIDTKKPQKFLPLKKTLIFWPHHLICPVFVCSIELQYAYSIVSMGIPYYILQFPGNRQLTHFEMPHKCRNANQILSRTELLQGI